MTPWAKALIQHSVFGIIPSVTIFLSIKYLASLRLVFSTRLFLLSFSFKIPLVSVRRISFSAFIAAAISPATKSALMLWEIPSKVDPMLEIIGMYPLEIRGSNISGLIFVTSPTNPWLPSHSSLD